MKKHLWIAVVVSVSTLNIHAEENPFILQESFQNIDQDADELLKSLKKTFDERKKRNPIKKFEKPIITIEETLYVDENITENNEKESNLTDIHTLEDNQENMDEEIVFRRALEEQETLAKEAESKREDEAKKLVEEKKEQEMQNEKRIEEEKNKEIEEEKIRLEKVEKEQAKIEAEKERVAKIEKEKQDILLAKEEKKKAEVQKKQAEEAEYKKLLETKEKEENEALLREEKRKENLAKKKAKREKIVDINSTKEEIEALKEADKAFLEAIKAVNRN